MALLNASGPASMAPAAPYSLPNYKAPLIASVCRILAALGILASPLVLISGPKGSDLGFWLAAACFDAAVLLLVCAAIVTHLARQTALAEEQHRMSWETSQALRRLVKHADRETSAVTGADVGGQG